MGKKATTISLEEHAWDLIQSYMDSKKLSNRNTAIEWIILEHNSIAGGTLLNLKDFPEFNYELVDQEPQMAVARGLFLVAEKQFS